MSLSVHIAVAIAWGAIALAYQIFPENSIAPWQWILLGLGTGMFIACDFILVWLSRQRTKPNGECSQ